MPPVRRARAALNAFGYAHLPILLGIVTVAAAERDGFTHPSHALSWSRAALLGGGVALYLAGDVLLRWELGIGRVPIRIGAALLAIATLPLGATISAAAEIAALVIVLVTAIGLETRLPETAQEGVT
jgi:low temperature requirement protein LtrA